MTSTITTHRTGKAAKILVAAEELLLKQGFKGVTMAAVAQRAHIGKGTPYLYWRTKEDLFLELIIDNLADALIGIVEKVRTVPDLALADRLCPTIADSWLESPLVRAVQADDAEVLGALVDDPRARAVVRENGSAALIRVLLPLWRDRSLIRTDWPVDEQGDALEIALVGYFVTWARSSTPDDKSRHRDALQRTVAATLLTDQCAQANSGLSEQVCAVIEGHAKRLRGLVPSREET